MSVEATYELCIDLTGDRDFADANEDVSAYVLSATTNHGFNGPWQEMGRSATMTVLLDNTGGQFSPDGGSALSGFGLGKAIRLRMTYSATTATMYLGRIDHIQPSPGTHGRRTCTLICEGFIRQLQEGEVAIPVMTDATSDEVITAILDRCGQSPAWVTGWRLGITGFSELGATTTLAAGTSGFSTLDTGIGTYGYVGDNWRNGTSPYRAIRDVTIAERGKFFEDRDGTLKFWNRHRLLTDLSGAVDATLTGASIEEAEYNYGEDAVNLVEVNYNPRRVSGVTVLGTADDEKMKVHSGKPITITVRFNDDETGARVSGLNVIEPKPYIDWRGHAHRGGKVRDMTKYVTVRMVASGDKAELTFTSSYPRRIHIRGLQVRGQKLLDGGRQKITERDNTQIAANGIYRRVIDSTVLQDTEIAQNIALWEMAAKSAPAGNLKSISFMANENATLMALARDLDIGDRLALSEIQTGASGEWFIVGMIHEARPRNHKVTYTLEPISVTTPWLLGTAGYSELGATTTLGV